MLSTCTARVCNKGLTGGSRDYRFNLIYLKRLLRWDPHRCKQSQIRLNKGVVDGKKTTRNKTCNSSHTHRCRHNEGGRECLRSHLEVWLNSFLESWFARMQSKLMTWMFTCVCLFCRKEFVEAYLRYVFSDSVSEQYSAFSAGFLKVCGGEILSLFQPSELMAMVVGNNNYNWEEMEKVCVRLTEFIHVVPLLTQLLDSFCTLTVSSLWSDPHLFSPNFVNICKSHSWTETTGSWNPHFLVTQVSANW